MCLQTSPLFLRARIGCSKSHVVVDIAGTFHSGTEGQQPQIGLEKLSIGPHLCGGFEVVRKCEAGNRVNHDRHSTTKTQNSRPSICRGKAALKTTFPGIIPDSAGTVCSQLSRDSKHHEMKLSRIVLSGGSKFFLLLDGQGFLFHLFPFESACFVFEFCLVTNPFGSDASSNCRQH